MGFNDILKGALPRAEDIQQIIDALTGKIDVGALTLLGTVAAPLTAPTVTLSPGALSGPYQWGFYWITGTPNGTGGYNVTGRTTPSPYSVSQTLASQEGNVSISGETVPTGAVGWGAVRNQSGGSTFYEVPGSEQFQNTAGSLPLVFIDNAADANLVTAAPSTNSTGSSLAGNITTVMQCMRALIDGTAIPGMTWTPTVSNSQITSASGTGTVQGTVTYTYSGSNVTEAAVSLTVPFVASYTETYTWTNNFATVSGSQLA